jgi:methylated-DNA-[protein]-cysteine S-methyltransferase
MSGIDAERITRVLRDDTEAAAAEASGRLVERADREGLAEIGYATLQTPLGVAVLAATRRGLLRVALPNQPLEEVLEDLAAEISPRIVELPRRLDPARRELDEYFEGRRESFDLALDWRLTEPGFSARVLRQTAKLPYGVTASYGEIAQRAGNPRAYRAAGSALGRNPIPIVVPCHRVLLSGGKLGNYGGGPEMKRWLLRLEGAIG